MRVGLTNRPLFQLSGDALETADTQPDPRRTRQSRERKVGKEALSPGRHEAQSCPLGVATELELGRVVHDQAEWHLSCPLHRRCDVWRKNGFRFPLFVSPEREG